MPLESRTHHTHPLSWYAKTYGLSISTIINYHRRNWSLDNAPELLQRILNGHGKKPPLELLQACATAQAQSSKPTSARPTAYPKPPRTAKDRSEADEAMNEQPEEEEETAADLDEPTIEPVFDDSRALGSELKRLKKECDKAFAEYDKEKRPADKAARLRIYKELVNTMRALAKDAPAADLGAKNVIAISDVDSTWSRSLKEICAALDILPRRASTHPGFRKLDPVDVEEILQHEINAIKAQLQGGSWLTPK